ncbi:unnamed protein product [Trichogramma brassicae]|uniref:Uncharacterized protein n=1 Tax=Trichogramma brassicae TaxID=86971 RepID=A0A6H5I9C7_9HYME|nr:unnamed protein product [Trichogramma brassicae]
MKELKKVIRRIAFDVKLLISTLLNIEIILSCARCERRIRTRSEKSFYRSTCELLRVTHPLLLALTHGHARLASLLLGNSADPNVCNLARESDLHVIVKRNDDDDHLLLERFFEVCKAFEKTVLYVGGWARPGFPRLGRGACSGVRSIRYTGDGRRTVAPLWDEMAIFMGLQKRVEEDRGLDQCTKPVFLSTIRKGNSDVQKRLSNLEHFFTIPFHCRDGEFWISYSDFVKTSTDLEVVHLNVETVRDEPSLHGERTWQMKLFHDSWCRNNRETFHIDPQLHLALADLYEEIAVSVH